MEVEGGMEKGGEVIYGKTKEKYVKKDFKEEEVG
jgi:hypothetical protein